MHGQGLCAIAESTPISPTAESSALLFSRITGSIRMVADGLCDRSIAFSSDWNRCYITDKETYDGLGNNVARAAATVYVQDVVEQMSPSGEVSFYLANKRVFAFADCGAPDGIKVDLAGKRVHRLRR
ncbi:hypothetical protein V1527DRAFT_467835 [Lipomyces starkeyi]